MNMNIFIKESSWRRVQSAKEKYKGGLAICKNNLSANSDNCEAST